MELLLRYRIQRLPRLAAQRLQRPPHLAHHRAPRSRRAPGSQPRTSRRRHRRGHGRRWRHRITLRHAHHLFSAPTSTMLGAARQVQLLLPQRPRPTSPHHPPRSRPLAGSRRLSSRRRAVRMEIDARRHVVATAATCATSSRSGARRPNGASWTTGAGLMRSTRRPSTRSSFSGCGARRRGELNWRSSGYGRSTLPPSSTPRNAADCAERSARARRCSSFKSNLRPHSARCAHSAASLPALLAHDAHLRITEAPTHMPTLTPCRSGEPLQTRRIELEGAASAGG